MGKHRFSRVDSPTEKDGGMSVYETLDAERWNWPWNLLKTKAQLKAMKPGAVLEVFVSASQDLESFAHIIKGSGHEILEANSEKGLLRILIKRADSSNWTPGVDSPKHHFFECAPEKKSSEE
jgi:TusA-related sulfurtransferase